MGNTDSARFCWIDKPPFCKEENDQYGYSRVLEKKNELRKAQ